MKGLRQTGMIVVLSMMIAPAASAQRQKPNDPMTRLIALSEAKHLRARRNLIKILREEPNFWIELQAIARRLKTQPAWLLNVMASESLFVPTARNGLPGQTASGLLQFIESTAQSLGTTTEAIRRMNPVEQLRLVEKYLAPFSGRLNSLADVYMAVFRGFIIDGKDETVIAPLDNSNKERRIYSLNRWLDIDSDSRITKGELSLAALTIGRFQPVSPPSARSFNHKPAAAPDRTPASANRQTRSIYIRSPKPAE